jgi:hypothetical protein
MGTDHIVEMEHLVIADDDFRQAADDIFALLQAAEKRYPAGIRSCRLSIEGHQGECGGFDADFFEFQQEFLLGAIGRFFTWVDMPLTGKLGNPEPQVNKLPDRLLLQEPEAAGYTRPA